MSSLFDFDKPALYAVMGNPVAHSKSPRIHGLFAAATGQRLHYSAIQVDPGGFEQAVSNFIAHGGKGLNVTVPFKGNAWALAKRRSLRAELARAVNTIVVEKDGTLFGDNTDGVGLITDLMRNHGADLGGKDVLLLGAGGAARGVIRPLLDPQPARLLGAFGWCFYFCLGGAPSPFLLGALSHGAATVLDGLGMLVEQAAEAFYLWRGVRPATAPVISTLRAELAGG